MPSPLTSGLYLVATPIGNLEDITLRALRVLREADRLYGEDTRVTGKLLRAYDIPVKPSCYHEHNAAAVRPRILAELEEGKSVALVSDAGTPLVSDPGYKLVEAALEAGHAVIPVPGPSSVMAALCGAGLPTDRFYFGGFLPAKSGARQEALRGAAALEATGLWFESPKRLAACLADMAEVLGGARRAAVARELTKLYEEFRRGALAELAAYYAEAGPPKGEVVIVVEGAAVVPDSEQGEQEIDRLLALALEPHSRKSAIAAVAALTGHPRNKIYERALALASPGGGGQK